MEARGRLHFDDRDAVAGWPLRPLARRPPSFSYPFAVHFPLNGPRTSRSLQRTAGGTVLSPFFCCIYFFAAWGAARGPRSAAKALLRGSPGSLFD